MSKVWPEGETVNDKCPFGCIFFPNSNALYGDCRMPESKDCHLNKILKGSALDYSKPETGDSLEDEATEAKEEPDVDAP